MKQYALQVYLEPGHRNHPQGGWKTLFKDPDKAFLQKMVGAGKGIVPGKRYRVVPIREVLAS